MPRKYDYWAVIVDLTVAVFKAFADMKEMKGLNGSKRNIASSVMYS